MSIIRNNKKQKRMTSLKGSEKNIINREVKEGQMNEGKKQKKFRNGSVSNKLYVHNSTYFVSLPIPCFSVESWRPTVYLLCSTGCLQFS